MEACTQAKQYWERYVQEYHYHKHAKQNPTLVGKDVVGIFKNNCGQATERTERLVCNHHSCIPTHINAAVEDAR